MLSATGRVALIGALTLPLGLGLLLLNGVGNAAASTQKSAASAVSSATIGPKARTLMNQMAVAYRSLRSYSGTVEEKETGTPQAISKRTMVAFRRPNRAVVVAADTSGKTWRSVSDGKNLYFVYPQDKNQYRRWALKPGQPLSMYLILARAMTKHIAAGLSSGQFMSEPPPPSVKSVTLGPPGEVNGVPVETVVVTPRSPEEPTWTFAIGKKDRLLRRLTMSLMVNGKLAMHTETHSQIKINPTLPDTTFTFRPPPGAKEVLSPPPVAVAKKRAVPLKR